MNSRVHNSHKAMNGYESSCSFESSRSTDNHYKESSNSSSADSSGSDMEETEDSCFKAPSASFRSTPLPKSRKKQKVAKKLSRNSNGNNDYGTPSFLKRIHISSDESDYSVKQVKKKAKRNSEVDGLPSYLRNLDISPKQELEGRKKTIKRNRERSTEKKRLKKKRRESNQLVTNSDQESQSYVSMSQPFQAQNKPSYSITSVPSLSAEIVVLQHPTSVTLHKFITVKVVSGGVSLLGWNMTALSEKVTIFSYERTGLVELTTLHADPMWKTKETYSNIKTALKKIVGKQGTISILEKCDNSSVIVMLQRASFTSQLKILSIYYPRESWLQAAWKSNRHFIKKKSCQQVIKFTEDHLTVAEAIAHAMRKATVNTNYPAPRVVICGCAHSGKSTVARFIINRLLDMFSHVFHLDADPGQPEFTPPGVVSLSKVEKCMIGPPFSHLRKPVKMVFTGAISAEASPPMYIKSINQLTQYFFKEHSSETLIVNTMGWMKGLGMVCLKEVIAMVEPTVIVELLEDGKESSFGDFSNPNADVDHYIIPAVKRENTISSYKGKENRDFSTLAYFGQCAKSVHLRPMSLNQMKTVCVCWDKIAIYVFGSKVMPYRLVEAINASFVALCTVDESLILKSDVPLFQTTVKAEPGNICHGFGIVRAIDEAQHLLHIVTPIQMEDLQKVNAIMKGNITVPDVVFLQQNMIDLPLPFVDQSKAAPSASREKVRKRSFRGQIGAN